MSSENTHKTKGKLITRFAIWRLPKGFSAYAFEDCIFVLGLRFEPGTMRRGRKDTGIYFPIGTFEGTNFSMTRCEFVEKRVMRRLQLDRLKAWAKSKWGR